jgi:hypothetical protein
MQNRGPVMFKAAICALIVLLTFVAFVKLADWPPLNTWETRVSNDARFDRHPKGMMEPYGGAIGVWESAPGGAT